MKSIRLLVVAAISSLIGSDCCSAWQDFPPKTSSEVTGDAAKHLLTVASESQSATYDSINTWAGQIEMEEVMKLRELTLPVQKKSTETDQPNDEGLEDQGETHPVGEVIRGKFFMHRTARLRFVVDGARSRLKSQYELISPTKFVVAEDSKTYQRDGSMRINSLQRPDGLFKLHVEQKVGEIQGFPLSTKRERPFTNLVTKEQALQAPPSVGDPTFDPRATFENGGMRIDKITRNYADQVTNPELASLFKVFWSDDRRYVNVQKRYKVGSSNDIDLHQLTFDAEARFLPVDVKHVVRGNIVQEMTWAYESINGIVVPKLFTLRKRGITDGELDVERICTFKESELNAPIDEAEFELASLGVADGDRLLDMTDNTLSIFVDGAPKVITGIEKALPAEGASKIALVLYFNFALLAVVAVVLLVRQLRRAKRAQ